MYRNTTALGDFVNLAALNIKEHTAKDVYLQLMASKTITLLHSKKDIFKPQNLRCYTYIMFWKQTNKQTSF